MSHCVGIIAKVGHPLASELVATLCAWLESHNYSFCVEQDTATAICKSLEKSKVVLRSELTTKCDPIVVFGGDGTLISVARHAAPSPPTIIGVNLGTLGFLTEINTKQYLSVLESVLAETTHREQRFLLEAKVMRGKHCVLSSHALNDVVITKEALARVFGVDVIVNGSFAATIRGDGVIVASPAGSTAYSLAAGGSVVHPQVQALLVTPICPHSLTSRPLILPKDFTVALRLGRHKGSERAIYLTIDGQQGFALEPDDEIVVTTTNSSVYFAKSSTQSYFDLLASKLKWATQ